MKHDKKKKSKKKKKKTRYLFSTNSKIFYVYSYGRSFSNVFKKKLPRSGAIILWSNEKIN